MLKRFCTLSAFVLAVSACVPVPIVLPSSADSRALVSRQAVALPSSAPSHPAFHAALNDLRRQAGARPVTANQGLDQVAARYAAEIARTGRLAHRDGQGRKATGRVRAAGVSTCPAGENLARGFQTAAQAFAGWDASPTHRANMTHPGYANYGIGRSGDVWVMVLLYPC